MRLIDADALISYFEEQYNTAMDDPAPVSGYVMAALRCCIDYFKTVPTVDAVEVVRCNWIPVSERLPEQDGRYLCIVKSFAFPGKTYQAILMCDKLGFLEGRIYTDDVTHWMPLPEPPKEDGHAVGFVDEADNPVRQSAK